MSSETGPKTPSERYLARLARGSFLSLWSYSNLHTAEGRRNDKGDGKEFCDLMVVFEDRILLFSDKDCEFPGGKDIQVKWNRWYRKAIEKSVKQLRGAEQWLLQDRGPLFLDSKCQHPFPLKLPDGKSRKIHLIAVTRGSHDACAQFFGKGSSGSYVLDTSVSYEKRAEAPFRLGWQLPQRFVHVFDELSLDVALGELDTVSDFVDYLDQKEALFKKVPFVAVLGEEDLIARYLLTKDENGRSTLPSLPDGTPAVMFEEGSWRDFRESEFYAAWKSENAISYMWDTLIEYQSKFIREGKALANFARDLGITNVSVDDHEWIVRGLASEPRLYRRFLAKQLAGAIEVNVEGRRFARVGVFGSRPDRGYVFLVVPKPADVTYEEYRQLREDTLYAYCYTLRLRLPNLTECIGIATEPRQSDQSSQDFLRLPFGDQPWTDEERKAAEEVRAEVGIYDPDTLIERRGTEYEFPTPQKGPTGNRAQRRAEAARRRRERKKSR